MWAEGPGARLGRRRFNPYGDDCGAVTSDRVPGHAARGNRPSKQVRSWRRLRAPKWTDGVVTAPATSAASGPPNAVKVYRSPVVVPEKFTSLRVLAALLICAAVLSLIGGFYFAYQLIKDAPKGEVVQVIEPAVYLVIGGGFAGLIYWVLGSLLLLIVSLEHQSRRTAEILERLRSEGPPGGQG